ncbi:hypothetical protein EJH33_25415 [Salmonella enterica subsp. enterica serovar Eastbourne]|uniref:Uncharacterized protein n=1 Tax=Salmonella enterica subsp. enterica serovar Eastbourne TaxID=486993 RepID=A0A702BC77_SALET|nr:hypothetical protein [Salmonella enterica subsp. enterica serovar Eastbourne]HAC6678964.1 hypothetical protein [Salmonella enterica subsp. enterica serovar Eastbourne]
MRVSPFIVCLHYIKKKEKNKVIKKINSDSVTTQAGDIMCHNLSQEGYRSKRLLKVGPMGARNFTTFTGIRNVIVRNF